LRDRRRLAAAPKNARHLQETMDLNFRILPGLLKKQLQQGE